MKKVRDPLVVDSSRESFGFACWSGDPGPMVGAHRHDDIEINVADQRLDYLLGGARLSIPAGRAAVFWAARPHQLVHVAEGTRVTWLTVPLALFLSWRVPSSFVTALLHGDLIVPDSPPGRLGADFARWEDDTRSGSDFALETSRLEVNAFLRRSSAMAHGPEARHDAARHEGPTRGALGSALDGALDSAATMAACIATRFAEPLTVRDVTTTAHVQPSHGMTLFKRIVGLTIGEYMTQCRVAEAQRLLISTGLSVGEIAPTAGFGSPSQFHERFRRATGLSPAAYRRQNPLRDAGAASASDPAADLPGTGSISEDNSRSASSSGEPGSAKKTNSV